MAFGQSPETMAPVIIEDEVVEKSVTTPGLSSQIKAEKKKMMDSTDVVRVLKSSPGVYAQEEDAQGLRPNIGLRGVYPHRSRKISFYEDGVLVGPAPYSAPAAYYSPFMTKIDRLEVHRGFNAVIDGPNSVGGAVHFFTKDIPLNRQSEVDFGYGSFDTRRVSAWHGGQKGLWGYLIQAAYVDSEGFKELRNDSSTGFAKWDALAKLRYTFPTGNQELELKVGLSDEVSNESYLGITRTDFNKNPWQRYSASEKDQMKWEQNQVLLTYTRVLSDEQELLIKFYNQNFHRNWYRFSGFTDNTINLLDIMRDPTGPNATYIDVLRGDQDSAVLGASGELAIAGNERTYLSQGLYSEWKNKGDWGGIRHHTKAGVLLHRDWIDRHHIQDDYEILNGHMARTGDPRTHTARNKDESQAVSVRLSEELKIGRWSLAGLLRHENVRYEVNDKLDAAKSGKENESAWVPGLGVSYELTPRWVLLAGVAQGITLAGPRKGSGEKPEESITYEIGTRWNSSGVRGEAVAFLSDYKNIKGVCSFASGCTDPNLLEKGFDGGRAQIMGLEALLESEFQWRTWLFPVSFTYTLIHGEFKSRFTSDNAEWGIGTIRSGDPLPYVPESQYRLSVGVRRGRFSQETAISWVGKAFDQSVRQNRQVIESYGWIDIAARYQITPAQQIWIKADNILDNEYIVSYRPFGARPGKPLTVMAGWKTEF